MGNTRERLGEDVSKILLRGDLDKSNLPLRYTFPDIVVLNINVFCMHMSFGIESKSNGGGVVPMKNSREFLCEANCGHKGVHPERLLRGACECHVFGLRSREGDRGLSLHAPGHSSPCHGEHISRC